MDDGCGILVHMLHTGKQLDRSRQTGQGDVSDQTHTEAFILRSDGICPGVLYIPYHCHKYLYGYSGADSCHHPVHAGDVQLIYIHSRGNGIFPGSIRYRAHQDSLPAGIGSLGDIYIILYHNRRNHEVRHRNLLDSRACIRHLSSYPLLCLYA